MTVLFLFTMIFIIAQFFGKSDYDRMKEIQKLTPFTKQEAENCYKKTFRSESCSCNNGIIVCPGCEGEKKSEFGVCAGCLGKDNVTCGKCGGNN